MNSRPPIMNGTHATRSGLDLCSTPAHKDEPYYYFAGRAFFMISVSASARTEGPHGARVQMSGRKRIDPPPG